MARAWRWIAAALSAGITPAAWGGLEPSDIAVIFNTRSPASLQIARYYINARKVPMNHLIPLTCDVSENMTEEQYRTSVVPQLIKALSDRKLLPDEKAGITGIKCLVTTYDVPLRIMAHEPTAAEKAEVEDMQKQLDAIAGDLAKAVEEYQQIAPAAAGTGTSTRAAVPATTPAKQTWQQWLPKLTTAIQGAGGRIDKLAEPDHSRAIQTFMKLQERVTGLAGVVATVQVTGDDANDDPARRQMGNMAMQVRDLQAQYQTLAKQRDLSRVRREMIDVRQKSEGLTGKARALEELIAYLRPDSTGSCFDNELALLLTDQNYPRANWIMNPMNVETYPLVKRQAAAAAAAGAAGGQIAPTVLMVTRLDGSTPAMAQELVDRAIKVEAKGLSGKFYLDARGLRGTDAYSIFDADLRRTADWMKQHSTMETVLEDTGALLEAKDAPEAAVYCGWYALKAYHDSGQWVKGAVGYHVASFEMESLHNPKETGWVVNLLNHGFAGTLGATDEPYLNAFPKPSQYFPLLLSGEFTQGEVWLVTSPMLSWRVGFVGDPLYNPFKAAPKVKEEDLRKDPVLKNAFEILGMPGGGGGGGGGAVPAATGTKPAG